jgi:hypothetical protein
MMTKKKLKYQYKPPSTLDINVEDYGTIESGPLPKPRDRSGVSLAPIGRTEKRLNGLVEVGKA